MKNKNREVIVMIMIKKKEGIDEDHVQELLAGKGRIKRFSFFV